MSKIKHKKKEPKRKLGRVIYQIQGFDNDKSINFYSNGLGLTLHCGCVAYELNLDDIEELIAFLEDYIGREVKSG